MMVRQDSSQPTKVPQRRPFNCRAGVSVENNDYRGGYGNGLRGLKAGDGTNVREAEISREYDATFTFSLDPDGDFATTVFLTRCAPLIEFIK